MDSAGARMGLYIVFLLLGVFYTCLGLRFNGYLNRFIVFWGAIGTILVVIIVPSMAQTHPSGKWVFTEFLNTTGYDNPGLTFMFALLQAGWSFVGYECGAQISEGTKNASSSGPRGIIIALSSAMVQALILCISTLFSIQDVEELQNSSSPVATLFLRATRNEKLSAFLLTILIVSQFGALCNVLLAGAQVMYAMARDYCLPNSKFWYKLNGKQQIPVRLLLLVAAICITVLLPSLASDVYYEAIISTSVICLNVSYGLPAFCRLIWKRNDMPKGPFDLGKYSIPINIIAVIWVIFFGVILCIPSAHPITPETMNWSCLMLGATIIFALTFWQVSGRKIYKGPLQTITGE
ncbi:amino acid/polyamine transporter I [Circinella umbellata]|nr:amino acid/polyamine transporter I [Circinella umbellata]